MFSATHISSGTKRAIKVLSRESIPPAELKAALCEISLLRSLVPPSQDHPNIIKIYEVITEADSVNIVGELCSGGDLFEKIADGRKLSESVAATYMKQILSALAYCHERNIVHRDLKPENLLLESSASDALIKMIDFGISQKFDLSHPLTDPIGTVSPTQPFYIAPEVLTRKYTEKCDIWSCGVLLYFMLSGKQPFYALRQNEVLFKVKEGVFSFTDPEWDSVSDDAKHLITVMLTKDPKARPTVRELMSDPWLRLSVKISVEDKGVDRDIMQRFKDFRSKDRLRQAALSFIASQLTSVQETEKLRRKFIEMDENKDGRLSREEISKGFSCLGLSGAVNIDEIMAVCDTDKSGYIDYSEFVTATLNWQKTLKEKQVEEAFKAFDEDHSGTIDLREMKAMFHGEESDANEIVWQELLTEADENGDGVIDMQEFKSIVFRHERRERRFHSQARRSI